MPLLVIEPAALHAASSRRHQDSSRRLRSKRGEVPSAAPPTPTRAELLAARDQVLMRPVAAALQGRDDPSSRLDGSQQPMPDDIRILGALGALVVPPDLERAVRSWLDRTQLPYRVSGGLHFAAATCDSGADATAAEASPDAASRDPHDVVRAWAAHAGGSGAGIRLGVADSGIDPADVDIQLEAFACFHAATGALLPTPPTDFSTAKHGTNICGLAADRRAGLAPDVTLLVAAVLTEETAAGVTGTEVQTAAGIDWLARRGADVINCSFGAPGWSDAWSKVVANLASLGVTMVAAMGNRAGAPLFPARFDGVVGVGALDAAGRPAAWSATGQATDARGRPLADMVKPDIWMPGDQLPSPITGGPLSGTSYAAPLYAAALCRVLSGSQPAPTPARAVTTALSAALGTPSTTGVSMSNNQQIAIGQQVLPTDTGFRIEDANGVLVGLLLRTQNGNTWIMDANNPWPNQELTMIVIPDPSQIELPPTTVSFPAPSHFEDVPTGGGFGPGVPPAANDRRYLIKNGTVTLYFIAADPTPGATVLEYGHPAPDNRLPLYGGYRYLPSTTLRLVSRPANFTPDWSKHRKGYF